MNSSRPSARYHSRWRSWRLHVDWLAQTTLYQVSQAQTAGWVKRNKKKNPKLVPARLGAVKLHFRCCRNILDVGLVTRLWLCLTVTVSPVLSTHDQCTRQASDMTCDSDVIEKPSRRWRGAVQQLADVVWESLFSCDYPCSRNRESNFFLTDLLTFFFCSLRLKIV